MPADSYVPFEESIVEELRQLLADGVTDPLVFQSSCRLIVNTEIRYGYDAIRQALAEVRHKIGLFTFMRDAFDSVNHREAIILLKKRTLANALRRVLNHLVDA